MQQRKALEKEDGALEKLLAYLWPERWQQIFLGKPSEEEFSPFEPGEEPVEDIEDVMSFYANNLHKQRSMSGADLVGAGPEIMRQV